MIRTDINNAYGSERYVYESLLPEASNLSIGKYLSKFLKSPITTFESEELKTIDAAILLGILPISLLLSIWSLIENLISFRINTAIGISGLLENRTEQMRLNALADISWQHISLTVLLLFAVWFALMMFVPLIFAKSKYSQPVQFKNLFSQVAAITLPMSLLFLSATAFGFIGLGFWLIPITVSLVIPLLFHFIVIRRFFPETPNKALYIAIVTQVIFVIITQQVLNAQMDNVLINIMTDIIWN